MYVEIQLNPKTQEKSLYLNIRDYAKTKKQHGLASIPVKLKLNMATTSTSLMDVNV